jgi:hypothetical protein
MDMRICLPLFFLLLTGPSLKAQNLNGQWKGGFASQQNSFGGDTEYVLDLEISGNKVGGLSYSYFIIGGKRCYVICKLEGNYDKAGKSMTVTETAKIKSNTPPDFRDCLQTHYLTFMKQGESEFLRGKWKGARPSDNCGTGETELERKLLVKVAPQKVAPTTPPVAKDSKPKTTAPPTVSSSGAKKPESKPKSAPAPTRSAPVAQAPPSTSKTATIDNSLPKTEKPQIPSNVQAPMHSKLEARSKDVIKTLEIPESNFRVDLYDNGQVDGDTISVFYNGKMVVEKQRLTTTPITLNITLDPGRNDNDLVMYAENLGSIPPNTALMVVTVAGKRYEVSITSTEQTSGTVRFRLKEE